MSRAVFSESFRQRLEGIVRDSYGRDVSVGSPEADGSFYRSLKGSGVEPVLINVRGGDLDYFSGTAQMMQIARQMRVPTQEVLGCFNLHHNRENLSVLVIAAPVGRNLEAQVAEDPQLATGQNLLVRGMERVGEVMRGFNAVHMPGYGTLNHEFEGKHSYWNHDFRKNLGSVEYGPLDVYPRVRTLVDEIKEFADSTDSKLQQAVEADGGARLIHAGLYKRQVYVDDAANIQVGGFHDIRAGDLALQHAWIEHEYREFPELVHAFNRGYGFEIEEAPEFDLRLQSARLSVGLRVLGRAMGRGRDALVADADTRPFDTMVAEATDRLSGLVIQPRSLSEPYGREVLGLTR